MFYVSQQLNQIFSVYMRRQEPTFIVLFCGQNHALVKCPNGYLCLDSPRSFKNSDYELMSRKSKIYCQAPTQLPTPSTLHVNSTHPRVELEIGLILGFYHHHFTFLNHKIKQVDIFHSSQRQKSYQLLVGGVASQLLVVGVASYQWKGKQ